jgi:hypothetical protein
MVWVEATKCIDALYVLMSKWVVVVPSNTEIYLVVQGEIKITNRLHKKAHCSSSNF